MLLCKRDTVANVTGADITANSNWRGSFRVPCVGWTASHVVTPEQQRAPKVTTYLSGSGTHTWSNGVTYARVRMLGGGGAVAHLVQPHGARPPVEVTRRLVTLLHRAGGGWNCKRRTRGGRNRWLAYTRIYHRNGMGRRRRWGRYL